MLKEVGREIGGEMWKSLIEAGGIHKTIPGDLRVVSRPTLSSPGGGGIDTANSSLINLSSHWQRLRTRSDLAQNLCRYSFTSLNIS